MRAHLVHGIRTQVGSPVLHGLIPYLMAKGIECFYPDYGYILGLETKRVNPIIVGCLLPYFQHGDILVCHSNGCAIAYDLMNAGAAVLGAVFINAALESDITLPLDCGWIDVYFNPGDTITEAAKLAAELPITFVDPVWGEMGHAGYSGKDPKIANINCAITPGLPAVEGHSDLFTPNKLPQWGPYIADRIMSHPVAKVGG